eukprot:COSAG01_NODE_2764_length_7112_cov_593.144018_8_plen_213_part_00
MTLEPRLLKGAYLLCPRSPSVHAWARGGVTRLERHGRLWRNETHTLTLGVLTHTLITTLNTLSHLTHTTHTALTRRTHSARTHSIAAPITPPTPTLPTPSPHHCRRHTPRTRPPKANTAAGHTPPHRCPRCLHTRRRAAAPTSPTQEALGQWLRILAAPVATCAAPPGVGRVAAAAAAVPCAVTNVDPLASITIRSSGRAVAVSAWRCAAST